jgi:phosphotransferase system IIB component
MSRKQYQHLLYTNFANIKTITTKFRKNVKNNKKVDQKKQKA